MKTFIRILFRTIGLPFFVILIIISCIHHTFKMSVNYMKYGGELIAYPKDSKIITDVYNKLEEHFNEQQK